MECWLWQRIKLSCRCSRAGTQAKDKYSSSSRKSLIICLGHSNPAKYRTWSPNRGHHRISNNTKLWRTLTPSLKTNKRLSSTQSWVSPTNKQIQLNKSKNRKKRGSTPAATLLITVRRNRRSLFLKKDQCPVIQNKRNKKFYRHQR